MTLVLIGMSAIMAVVVGWLLRQTRATQPWIEQRAAVPPAAAPASSALKAGLGVFLTVATAFFALFISAYFMRREGADWRPIEVPALLWFNTLVLILASVCFQSARARSGQEQGLRRSLLAGVLLSWMFLAGQLLAWQQLQADGYSLRANPANAFFYVLTALHGLHLLGGLWVWATTMFKLRLGGNSAALRLRVELCTIYWHFLLLVWLVLFALLAGT